MVDLNKVLKNASLYSIEYCGFYIFKFSISHDSAFYDYFKDLNIEFISGIQILDLEEIFNLNEIIFNLFGAHIQEAKLTNENSIELKFSNGYSIRSMQDENYLTDRDWVIEFNNNKNDYILSDKGDLYYSDSLKFLLE